MGKIYKKKYKWSEERKSKTKIYYLEQNIYNLQKIYDSGYSLSDIGKMYNCSMELVRRVFKRKNIKIRSKKEQQALPNVKFKNSITHKGKRNSQKTEFKKGTTPWNKKDIDEEKLIEDYLDGDSVYILSKKYKISRTSIAKRLKKNNIQLRGGYESMLKWNKETPKELKPSWKGGVSPLNQLILQTPEYQKWRKEILARDNYTCQVSGVKGGELHVHHTNKTFASIKKEAMNNLGFKNVTIDNKYKIIKEFLIINSRAEGITLSKEEHINIHSNLKR